jgi:adenylate cyclase
MRQLAAILFSDIAGYTALVQENEQLAKRKRERLREVLEKNVQAFNGRILQYYGDGALSIFTSAIDAVHCAISIQSQLKKDPVVDLRIGIHTGDVAIEDNAIYGDGVNLASRIESLSVAGGIFISEKVYDEIRNQEDIQTREIGYFELKNIRHPVRIFAITNPGLTVPSRADIKGKTAIPSNRLAVLPFVNMSADPENEYFSDGITEELLNALTKVDGLQVTSRTSAFAFKGKNDDIRDIGVKLNVDKILEGSVRKSGNRVRITAQLINAADGYHIWSENYDRNLTDIFEVQDEISNIIANRLRENLSIVHKNEKLVHAGTNNIEAYTLYLKGMHYWNKITPADGRKAIEYFELAIQAEPGYAQAYAMVAAGYSYLGATGQMQPKKAFEIVHRYSSKAIQLNENIAEGYIAKASAYLFYDWNWKQVFEFLQKAISLNPGAIEAYRQLGFYYILTGKKEEAVITMQQAIRIDPLSPMINLYLGEAFIFNERYDEGIVQADKVLEMNPQMRLAIELKGWCAGMGGDWEKALELFKEQHRLTNHPLKGLMTVGVAYGMLGQIEKAMECIRKIEQRQLEEPDTVMDSDLAAIWYAIGDLDKFFYYMNESVDKRIGLPTIIFEYPMMKEAKKDPRYPELLKRVNL